MTRTQRHQLEILRLASVSESVSRLQIQKMYVHRRRENETRESATKLHDGTALWTLLGRVRVIAFVDLADISASEESWIKGTDAHMSPNRRYHEIASLLSV